MDIEGKLSQARSLLDELGNAIADLVGVAPEVFEDEKLKQDLADFRRAYDQLTPELEAELMLNSDIAIQGWGVATVTEAQLLMEIGKHQEAKAILREEVGKFRQLSENWAIKFLDDENNALKTAYRFEGSPFQKHISPERVQRISQIYPNDQTLNEDKMRRIKNEIIVEFQMSYASERYPEPWVNKQLAIAEYLDTLSELLARLDTLQDFAQLCQDRGVKSSKELLPSNEAEPGLYLLEAGC